MHRLKPRKKEYRRDLHNIHSVRRSIRRSRNAELCIPIIYPQITSTCATSSPIHISNSAGATPVRGAECEIKLQSVYSTDLLPRPPSANSADYHPGSKINDGAPIISPPGPPASPVPSPSADSCIASLPSAASSLDSFFHVVKLRKRRNAICSQIPMAKGLRDFLVSYIVSHLTDSMTSSLSLTAAPTHSMMEEDGNLEALGSGDSPSRIATDSDS